MDVISPTLKTGYWPFIQIDLPFCIYLQDATYSLLGANKQLINLHIEKVWRKNTNNEGELYWDKRGIYRHTRATIFLSASPWGVDEGDKWLSKVKVKQQQEIPKLINKAIISVNQFIRTYRYITDDYYLNEISDLDLGKFKIGRLILENKGQYYEKNITYTPFFPPWFTPIPIKDKSNETHKLIIDRLQEFNTIPLYKELLMNAKDWLQRENYRLAVVEVETAFEVLVKEIITMRYKNKTKEYIANNIYGSGFRSVIKDHLSKMVAFKTNVEEYDQWNSNAYLIRQKAVHEGSRLTKVEAHNAIVATNKAIEYLKKHLDTIYPGIF